MNEPLDWHADPSLLSVLSLAPLVAIAWAEAGIDAAEREMLRSCVESARSGRRVSGVEQLPWPDEMIVLREIESAFSG